MRRLRLWLSADDDRWAITAESLIARCWVDENDQPILSPSEASEGYFDEVDGGLITALGEACDLFTGFTKSSYNVQRIEELSGN